MGYTSPIKETIYERILEVLEGHRGEGINPTLLKEIKKDLHILLNTYVISGAIDATKWHNDNEVRVEAAITDPNQFLKQRDENYGKIHIYLPKWLEDWLESDDEEI